LDLRLPAAEATADERAAVDTVLGGAPADANGHVAYGGHDARSQRHLLLPVLHAIQDEVGWISPGALGFVGARLDVPPAEAYGVATFYALFSTEPRPRTVVHVCDDIACRTNGALELCEQLERSDLGDGAAWMRSPCLGQCEKGSAALFQSSGPGPRYRAMAPASHEAIMGALTHGWISPTTGRSVPQAGTDGHAPPLLRRVGAVDPSSLDDYRAHGGYEALRRAVALGPDGVIREVKDAKLLGRGGAAFPTGVKWEAVAKQPVRPHYFVCNADESEPGTFKDRVLMEQDPFALLEAMTIAGYATASEHGYLYVRGEYPQAEATLRHAVDEARRRGSLGPDVMGEGFAFDVEIRRGAGAYIAGEETALFNSIEGKRAEPRNKPPFPVERGLFGKPTGVNNVETLLNVLEILRIGGPAFAATGTEESTGTRLFCLSGCVERPGLYEVEFGATLGDLLQLAGGVRGGAPLRAVLLGGAAGAFVGPDMLDLPLTFEATRAAGVTLGSGVIMAFDEEVNLVDVLLRIARFFRDESCGQCVPCRVGTVRQEELLHRLATGRVLGSRHDELQLLNDVAQVMRDASICGLGQTAAGAIQSAIRTFDLFPIDGGQSA
jgi:NADH-quinone oxidoreductase subunit F